MVRCILHGLARQAGIIDTCLSPGHINYAIGLIREWSVSAAMLRQSQKLLDAGN